MNQELKNLTGVWASALASLAYAYHASARTPSGALRLLALLPVVVVLTLLPLPLRLSTIHLGGPTTFFLVWLANFKLLLLAFNHGPLPKAPNLLHFLALASLPVKVKAPDTKPGSGSGSKFSPLLFALKSLLLLLLIHLYEYRPHLHRHAILALYCVHMYLELEIVLAICAIPARVALGFDLELEPQFNEPYLATSLQDFWGRRWNLMVSSAIRSTVYNPLRHLLAPLLGGPKAASIPATVVAFSVSGLMHELIYYYLTWVQPTWEVTWFFVLHGLCVAAEMAVKRWIGGRWSVNRLVSGPLTLAFAGVTGYWWFFPQLLRNGVDEKVLRECLAIVNFVKDESRSVASFVLYFPGGRKVVN